MTDAWPVTALLHALRGDGFPIGVDDHLRVARLLATREEWPNPLLRTVLRAMLVRDRTRSARFEAVFDRLLSAATLQEAPEPVHEPAPEPSPRPRPAFVLALGLAVLAAVLAWRITPPERTSIAVQPRAVQIGPRRAETPATGAAHVSVTGPTATSPVAPVPQSEPLPAITPDEQRDMDGILPGAPRIPRRVWSWLAVAAASIGAMASLAAVRRRRRNAPTQGPWIYEPTVPPAWRAPAFAARDVNALADTLDAVASEDRVARLDVAGTVERTAGAAGYPTIAYRHDHASPTIAFAIEKSPASAPWRGLFEELADALGRSGLAIQRWTFGHGPERLESSEHGAPSTSPDELTHRVDRLIIVGGAAREASAGWLDRMEDPSVVCWMDPRPAVLRADAMGAARATIPVRPATLDALRGWTEAGEVPEPQWTIPPARLDAVVRSRGARAELARFLGMDAWHALLVASHAPTPDAATALWMAQACDIALSDDARSRLLTLAWFADGAWPSGWPLAAMRELAAMPTLYARSRKAWASVLAATKPGVTGVASMVWEAERSLHDRLERPERVERGWHPLLGSPAEAIFEDRQRAAGVGAPRRLAQRVFAVGLVATAAAMAAGAGGVHWWAQRYVRWRRFEHVARGRARPVDAAVLDDACGAGDGRACVSLGMRALRRRVPSDSARAMGYFHRACGSGLPRGCLYEGRMYRFGVGAARDDRRAVALYRQACDGRDLWGCSNLGYMYDNVLGVTRDAARAVQLYQQACQGGEMRGCTNLGVMYDNGRGLTRDYARAVQLYQQACQGGQIQGCNNLGVMYENGRGLIRDYARAVQLYQQACQGGQIQGCNNLGVMYENGRGLTRDYARAVQLYQQACQGGQIQGCNNLGVMYENGLGATLDAARAVQLYQQACQGGEMRGCTNLGIMYESGRGLTRDRRRANELYRQACDGGDSWGCERARDISR